LDGITEGREGVESNGKGVDDADENYRLHFLEERLRVESSWIPFDTEVRRALVMAGGWYT
jgi:hypothetical protein